MNKIYKVVKNNSTGCSVVVSELAKGVQKSRKLILTSIILVSAISSPAYADDAFSNYTPENNSNKQGSISINGTTIIDLAKDPFNKVEMGNEVIKNTVDTTDTIDSLYKTKYSDVQNATNIYNEVINNPESTVAQIEAAEANLAEKKELASNISDDKFKVTDTNNLIGTQSEGVVVTKKELTYWDPVTDSSLKINVVSNLTTERATASMVTGDGISVEFYEKMQDSDQYSDMQLININGTDTDVTIKNNTSDVNNTNGVLTAISKDGTGVISVKDGANLTFDASVSYYTGGWKSSESKPFDDNASYSKNSSESLYQVTYKGNITSPWGETFNIKDDESFNDYNAKLIAYIQNTESVRLTYSTTDRLQKYYEDQINELYTLTELGKIEVEYNLSNEELLNLISKDADLQEAFNNRVTNKTEDADDIGLKTAGNNYLVGVEGSGSVITINEGKKIINTVDMGDDGIKVSSGTIIKADFTGSGLDSNTVINVDGALNANNGMAIVAKNTDLNVSETGYINGDVELKKGTHANTVHNEGVISGEVTITDGLITNTGSNATINLISGGDDVTVNNENDATITSSVNLGNNSHIYNSSSISAAATVGNNSSIINKAGAKIGGEVIAGQDSTVINENGAEIDGMVSLNGNGSRFENSGKVGGIKVANDAEVVNESAGNMVGDDSMAKLYTGSKLVNTGDIYIGYTYNADNSITGNTISNDEGYTAFLVSGFSTTSNNSTTFTNENNINLSGSQKDVIAVSVENGATFNHISGATITLNKDDSDLVPDSYETGNNNTAVSVAGTSSIANVEGDINLNDIGSTGIFVASGAEAVLTGNININSKNWGEETADETAVRSFGVWVQGTNSNLVLKDNALVNMNADRAIGVHVRNGAKVEIKGQAGIVFSEKENQIGFLISGITDESSILYNTSQELKLNGTGSVLFRVERGSKFSSATMGGTTSLAALDSNNTEDSTLIVITNGAVDENSEIARTTADLSDFKLTVSGKNAKGVRVEGGAEATITDKTEFLLTGDGATLAKVDGNYYDLNGNVGDLAENNTSNDCKDSNGNQTSCVSTLISSAKLLAGYSTNNNVIGSNSVGYYLTNGGVLEHSGTIDFGGNSVDNIGVKINTGGTLINKAGSFIKVNGTAIEISGERSAVKVDNEADGDSPVIWAVGTTKDDSAYHLKDLANLNLTGEGITKAEGTAHGILVEGAAQLVLDGATLDLYGNDIQSSSGNGIENRYGLQNILLKNKATINVKDGYGIHSTVGFSTNNTDMSGIINVYGKGTGLRFEHILPTGEITETGTVSNAIINNGYKDLIINVYEETGHGIYTNSDYEVDLSTSVNIISETGQSALEIKGVTKKAAQSGNYHSANKNAVIVDLNNGYVNTFTNNGELLFGDFAKDANDAYVFTSSDKITAATGKAIATNTSENGLNFTNGASGKINGTVELLGYGDAINPSDKTKGNTVTLVGGSEGNVFRTGEGDDTFILSTVNGNDIVGNEHQVNEFSELDGGDGHDSVKFDEGSNFTITKNTTIINIEDITLDNASNVMINLSASESLDGLNEGVETYTITDEDSTLTYKWTNSNTTFDRLLKGKGTFLVNLGVSSTKPTNGFAFNNSTNIGSFEGTLELTNTNYTLNNSDDHKNTQALTNATLKVSDNSYVKVGEGDQTIEGLDFNGGTIDFGRIELIDTPEGDITKADNYISVNELTLSKGNVQIDVSDFNYNPKIPTDLSLLEQDSANMITQLVSANEVNGGTSGLKLLDENDNEITYIQVSELIQNSENIARATYDVRLTKGDNNDGLYVGYGLTQIELKTKNDINGEGNALILDASNSNPSKQGSNDLDVLVTDYINSDGTVSYGDLQIHGGSAVSLSGSNTYHGSTHVKDSGIQGKTTTLVSGNDNALGSTRLLRLDYSTKFDLNGWSQSIGSLYTHDNSTVDLNNGVLKITGKDGTDSMDELVTQTSAGSLTGAGKLIIGDTTLIKSTSSKVKATVIGDNTELNALILNANNGQIDLDSQGGLGTGALTNNGELNLNFTIDSTLTNTSLAGNGTINKLDENLLTFTVEQAKEYAGTVNVNNGTVIFNGNTNNDSYAANMINVASGSVITGINNASFSGTVNNSGTFYIGETLNNTTTVSNQTVTVGNYNGTVGSLLVFNGVLAGDDSLIDKLIITGNSSGTSYVKVNNIGGLGAETINGISIIDVKGRSDAEFLQMDKILAGAYEYKLVRSSSDKNNWVLKNNSDDDPDNVRPDFGSYIGNMYSANNLFNTRLHDRLGETQYTDQFTGEQKVTSMWMRHQYGYDKFKASNRRLNVKDNWNVTQIGADIAQWSNDGLNRLHLGVMAGYGHSSTDSKSRVENTKSKGTINGYSYGVYATWYDNDADKTGLYVDTWALWNRFSASVKSDGLKERYTLKGLTASVESGYTFLTGSLGNYDVWLQPKGQAIFGGVKTHGLTEENGTRLGFNDGNIQTRLGVRISLLSNVESQLKTNKAGQLFIEANWLHNTKLYNVKVNEEKSIGQDGARNIGELKVGMEGYITKNANIWLNLTGQRGDHNYENASVMLGLKYSF